ncbi:MAG: SagB/ThcOx family dehydrogenase [Desulfurococcaceae archaeon]
MEVKLPEPSKDTPLSQLLLRRKSIRRYKSDALTHSELSCMLWATYGLVNRRRHVVPSAGATYPVEIYVFIKNVIGLKQGIYRYDEVKHSLILVKEGDFSRDLAKACLDQSWVRDAPINIVIVARYEKTTSWYGDRGLRYIHFEAGHIGQNIYLAATELGLGTVAVGAFIDESIAELIGLGKEYIVLYVFPVGKPA